MSGYVRTGLQARRISLIALIVALAAAFSLAVGWYQLFGLRELHEYLEYDDGVWFGTSVRLAHGIFPYRNFVDDQPPGVPVVMLPFALLSRSVGTATGLAAARVAVPLFETVGVLALGWMLRHRGALTVAVACGAMAVYPVCLIDQRTVMLEPFCATFCLLGLAAVFDGDRLSGRTGPLVVGGAFFGLAGSCKASRSSLLWWWRPPFWPRRRASVSSRSWRAPREPSPSCAGRSSLSPRAPSSTMLS